MKNLLPLILLIALIAVSCQKKLEREDAKSMIATSKGYPIQKNFEIIKSYIKDVKTEGRGVTALIGEDQFKETEKAINQFASLNLLKLDETQQREETTQFLFGTTIRTWTIVKVSLSDEGKKYLVQDNDKSYLVKLWETDIAEITGIQEMKESKSAKVDYTISNKSITPFGDCFGDKNQVTSLSAYFSLYDDGWRIQ
jgi:protein-arginine kinase